MNGKNPTRQQKNIIKENNLNPQNWLVLKNPTEGLYIKHKVSGNKRILKIAG